MVRTDDWELSCLNDGTTFLLSTVRSTGSVDIYPGDVKTGAVIDLTASGGLAHVSAASTNANFGELL